MRKRWDGLQKLMSVPNKQVKSQMANDTEVLFQQWKDVQIGSVQTTKSTKTERKGGGGAPRLRNTISQLLDMRLLYWRRILL